LGKRTRARPIASQGLPGEQALPPGIDQEAMAEDLMDGHAHHDDVQRQVERDDEYGNTNGLVESLEKDRPEGQK